MITHDILESHFDALADAISSVLVTDSKHRPLSISTAFIQAIKEMNNCRIGKRKLIFIGNGGSAAIASHMAIDYTKNGGIPAIAFNDSSTITCLANDFGYEKVFSKAIELYADKDDIVIAISSSGTSQNILNAADQAKQMGCLVYTLSGFSERNTLRVVGDLNFYVPTKKGEYGLTEIAHLAILHSILDIICKEKK